LRPSAIANANSSFTIFSHPSREISLRLSATARCLHVLYAGVEVLDVLADDDDVQLAAREGGLDAGQLSNRPYVAVRLEPRAKA